MKTRKWLVIDFTHRTQYCLIASTCDEAITAAKHLSEGRCLKVSPISKLVN